MFRKLMIATLATATLLLASSAAQADETRSTAATTVAMERGYGYVFKDDPLDAGNFGSNTAVIKVRHRGSHTLLIRPRVQFVTEMLKSAESL
jgi:hypothetical protein